jgi:hypothetical protein
MRALPNSLGWAVLRRWGRVDGVLLCGLIALCAAPYLPGLGFYSDDWGFLGAFATAPDESLGGLWHRQYIWHTTTRHRPTQIALQVLLFRAFGLHPSPYHVTNVLILSALAILIYAVFCQFEIPRHVAIAVPALYVLLPNYSTNRFWFASFGYAVSLTFCVLSLFADLQGLQSSRLRRLAWKLVALLALAIGGLGYELVMPLFLLNLWLVWLRARPTSRPEAHSAMNVKGAILYLSSNVFVLGLILAYKVIAVANNPFLSSNTQRPNLYHLAWVVYGAIKVNFGTYGIAAPYAVLWSASRVRPLVWVLSTIGGAMLLLRLLSIQRMTASSQAARRLATQLAALGLLVFALGYSVFIVTKQITFTSTGNGNRVNMAAALGVALLFVAGAVWISSLGRRPPAQKWLFSSIVVVLCFASSLIDNAIADFWTRAWSKEKRVVSAMERTLAQPDPKTSLLIDGVCPYIGPAVVLETWWDTSGMIQVIYEDQTLSGDVTSGRVELKRQGVVTTVYDSRFHRYGPNLLLFDVRHRRVRALENRRQAQALLEGHTSNGGGACAQAVPGKGVPVFPFDLYRPPFIGKLIELVS